jgi:hypothetical protein
MTHSGRQHLTLLDRTGIAANVGLRPELTFWHTTPRPFDSSELHRLLTVRTLYKVRTVMVLEGMISLENSALRLVPPTKILRTVAPTRRPNADLRTREHLTAGEVDSLIDAAKANRYGHRDAGYHMAFGPPYPGDPDRRPNAKLGEVWGEAEATIARYAVLWLAFREEVEGTGQKFGDIFDGGDWIVAFDGTPAIIGSPFTMRIWQTSLVFPELVGQNPN